MLNSIEPDLTDRRAADLVRFWPPPAIRRGRGGGREVSAGALTPIANARMDTIKENAIYPAGSRIRAPARAPASGYRPAWSGYKAG